MNQDEFYQRVREIASIECDITRLQERLHTLYHEIALQAQEGVNYEANPNHQIPVQASAAARPALT